MLSRFRGSRLLVVVGMLGAIVTAAACSERATEPRQTIAPTSGPSFGGHGFGQVGNPQNLSVFITQNDGDPAGYGTYISTSTTLKIGQSLALKAVVRDSLGNIVTTSAISNQGFNWTYDNNACIKVSSTGVATAVKVKPFDYNNPTKGAAYVTYAKALGGTLINCDTLP